MKKISFLLFVTIFSICTFATFSIARDKPLTAQQVTKLFSGKTITVTEPGRDKSTGKNYVPFKVHVSPDGFIRVVDEEAIGPAKGRIWSVTKEGQFCYSFKLTQRSRRSGRTCGFIVPAGAGAYGMYSLSGSGKRAKDRSRAIVGGKGSTHLWTFSNFK